MDKQIKKTQNFIQSIHNNKWKDNNEVLARGKKKKKPHILE
jgi:hypothetical protein